MRVSGQYHYRFDALRAVHIMILRFTVTHCITMENEDKIM